MRVAYRIIICMLAGVGGAFAAPLALGAAVDAGMLERHGCGMEWIGPMMVSMPIGAAAAAAIALGITYLWR